MKVFVAGHKGLVGSSLVRRLQSTGFELIFADRSELDLRDSTKVKEYFSRHQPDWVFVSAAVVGGIMANKTQPVTFLLDNLKIQNNIIEASFESRVKKLMFFASNCMYPKEATQPFQESSLLKGAFEPTNEAYALAKVAGLKLCQAYNTQFGTQYLSVVPTTLYGMNDNYHKENAHVLPMLLRRFHEANLRGDKEVIMWGSGTPTREFLFSDDLAEACLHLMQNADVSALGGVINIGSGSEISIKDLGHMLKEVVGLKAEIKLDATKPNGVMRKRLDSSKIFELGWKPKVELYEGLQKTYADFLNNPQTRL